MVAQQSSPVQLGLFDDLGLASTPDPAQAGPARDAPVSPRVAAPVDPAPSRPMGGPAANPAAAPFVPPAPERSAPSRPPGAREVTLDGHAVAYALRRARRRSIGFTVGPEGLAVSAPRWVGIGEVESALQAKAGWILRKLQEARERRARVEAAQIEWRDGGVVPFLGEDVILVLDPRATGAVLRGAEGDARDGAGPTTAGLPGVPRLTLHLGLPPEAQPAQIRDTVQSWLQRQARRLFQQRCEIYAERLGVRMRRLALSSASTRWGSASADGSIRLNWRLVHFGLPVIDYVVAHELAHLREMNHSPAFWDVVRQALPGFEEARGVLRKQVLPAFD
jgi:predicted metal-dependent hydrolase